MTISRYAQVSLEVMFAVGTMIIMFFILTGVNFNREREVTDLREYTTKLDRCNELAQYINGVYTLGDNATAKFYTRQYAFFIDDASQSIIVSDENLASSIDASCTFVAPAGEAKTLEILTNYDVTNKGGLIYLEG